MSQPHPMSDEWRRYRGTGTPPLAYIDRMAAELDRLHAEAARLRAALEEIAHHGCCGTCASLAAKALRPRSSDAALDALLSPPSSDPDDARLDLAHATAVRVAERKTAPSSGEMAIAAVVQKILRQSAIDGRVTMVGGTGTLRDALSAHIATALQAERAAADRLREQVAELDKQCREAQAKSTYEHDRRREDECVWLETRDANKRLTEQVQTLTRERDEAERYAVTQKNDAIAARKERDEARAILSRLDAPDAEMVEVGRDAARGAYITKGDDFFGRIARSVCTAILAHARRDPGQGQDHPEPGKMVPEPGKVGGESERGQTARLTEALRHNVNLEPLENIVGEVRILSRRLEAAEQRVKVLEEGGRK